MLGVEEFAFTGRKKIQNVEKLKTEAAGPPKRLYLLTVISI
jgi:hypothetical protein